MGLAHIAPLIEADNYYRVRNETFGHLAPRKNKTYRGKILVAVSQYRSGTAYLIDTEIPEMEDSPWFFDAVNDYVFSLDKLERGSVYEITITFRNYQFWGKPKFIYKMIN